jgi:hypothetical protein
MSYEKDKLDSYVTSASLSTALATYATSASVSSAISAAVGSIDLSAYVSSNSLSAAVATDALTVRGPASVSATMSAAAVTVAGRPVGAVLLGYTAIQDVTSIGFSGSWSDFAMLDFQAIYRISGASSASLAIFTDGGDTPILALTTGSTVAAGTVGADGRVLGGNGIAHKHITGTWRPAGSGGTGEHTATANAGFVNCLRFGHSKTMSSGVAVLLGYRIT